MNLLKRSVFAACLSEGLAFLLVVAGTRRTDDVISTTWFGKIGILLHWPGMKVEDHAGSLVATICVPLVIWFLVWLVVWSVVDKIRGERTPNNTPEDIRR